MPRVYRVVLLVAALIGVAGLQQTASAVDDWCTSTAWV
jgi:hypothetical protein